MLRVTWEGWVYVIMLNTNKTNVVYVYGFTCEQKYIEVIIQPMFDKCNASTQGIYISVPHRV